MKADEGIELSKMTVTALLLSLAIGAVVFLSYIAIDLASSGQNQLEDELVFINDAELYDFDEAQVSGYDVLQALNTFRDSNTAVLVCNRNDVTPSPGYFIPDESNYGPVMCANYCAKIRTAAGVGANGLVQISWNTTTRRWEFPEFEYVPNSATIAKNIDFSATRDISRTLLYVPENTQWYASLIYDASTGNEGGVIFRQIE